MNDLDNFGMDTITLAGFQVLRDFEGLSGYLHDYKGEGVHSAAVADLVHRLDQIVYSGDYSFEVLIDDCQQIPLLTVCQRAYNSAAWVSQNILRKWAPLPDWTSARPEKPSATESI